MKKQNPDKNQNPSIRKAVALQYDEQESSAPAVIAKGEGFVAQRIIEIAQTADVPIVEDAALVSALLSLELGQEIPVELYTAVARILSWIYKLDKGEQP